MAQSLSSLYVHAIFSTKDRHPFLAEKETRLRVHRYIGGISASHGCPALEIGGVEDHVHVLGSLSRTITVSNWISQLKAGSSSWIKDQDFGLPGFAWQGGYAVLSVGKRELDIVRRYIVNQEIHHHGLDFQSELRRILDENEVEYDEWYLWN